MESQSFNAFKDRNGGPCFEVDNPDCALRFFPAYVREFFSAWSPVDRRDGHVSAVCLEEAEDLEAGGSAADSADSAEV